jgi:hypothetical protein
VTAAAPAAGAAFPARAIALFAAASVAVVALAGGILAAFYRSPIDRKAIAVSAGIALVVQLLAFTVVRLVGGEHVIAAWGVGAIMRFAVLVLHALVIAPALGLPAGAALVSVAVFLFALTVLEPLFLKL